MKPVCKLNSVLKWKAKYTSWECAAAAVNEVGQRYKTVFDITKK